MKRHLARAVVATAAALAVVGGTSGVAQAESMTLWSDWAEPTWKEVGPFNPISTGDDLGFDNYGETSVDMRWVNCTHSAYGKIVRNIRGAGQGAVLIGKNFKKGACVHLQFRTVSGNPDDGPFRGKTYYAGNLAGG